MKTRASKFIKEFNISLTTLQNILGSRSYNYGCLDLNTLLKDDDVIFLTDKLKIVEDEDTIKEITNDFTKVKKAKKLTNLRKESSEKYRSEDDFDYLYHNYSKLQKILIMNLRYNEQIILPILAEYNIHKFGRLDFSNTTEAETKLEKIYDDILEIKGVLTKSRKFSHEVVLSMDELGFQNLVKALCEKKVSPVKAPFVIERFKTIHKSQIHIYRYENFKKYSKVIDFRNGVNSKLDEDYYSSTSKSVFSMPNPFRN